MNAPIETLTEEISKQVHSETLTDFLSGLLTPNEIEEFSRRIEIVRLLKEGMPQHAIAKKLGVGIATVTRGAKELHKGRFTDL